MTDRWPRGDRRAALRRAAPALLVLALGVAWFAPQPDALRLRTRGPSAEALAETIDALPSDALVLVAFDPDAGTYAEIRPAVRALLAVLLARPATLVVTTLTPEGRALWLAERARLASADADAAITDLGFIAGAEAAIVALARGAAPPGLRSGTDARLLDSGLTQANLLVVVGGNDMGPRSWIEQFLPRVEPMPAIAVAPTVLLPELVPYEASGQLDAVIVTPGDVAEARAALGGDGADAEPAVDRSFAPPLAVLVGLLAGLAVLAHAIGSRAGPGLRRRVRDGS